jgi:hypothetical protein
VLKQTLNGELRLVKLAAKRIIVMKVSEQAQNLPFRHIVILAASQCRVEQLSPNGVQAQLLLQPPAELIVMDHNTFST